MNSDRWSADWGSSCPKTTRITTAIVARTATKRLQTLVIRRLLRDSSVVVSRPTVYGCDERIPILVGGSAAFPGGALIGVPK
jgi:hypothetical protein